MVQKKILSQIKRVVFSEYPTSEIILYGSHSRDEARPDSDWDILIIIDDDLAEKNKIDLHNKIYDIELSSGEIINSIIHTKQEWTDPLMQVTPFYNNVVNEGAAV